ncbi:MAG: hypothetical protein M3Z49_09640, partial [Bifidobacteriales bacterium]|nr:hypothetical protein [Bifidobacteriales bacterium]
MSDDQSKKRLGRGLAALIGDVDLGIDKPVTTRKTSPERQVPIEFISRNPQNPRRHFTETELDDLAQSI